MTVYPAPSQVMHTEVDVTMSSVQVHATSSKPASGLEHTGSACDSHAPSAGANATLATSAQGVPTSAAASGDGEKEGQNVADVSEAALPSPRTVVSLTDVVATDKAANSGGPAAMPAASNSTVEDCSKVCTSRLCGGGDRGGGAGVGCGGVHGVGGVVEMFVAVLVVCV